MVLSPCKGNVKEPIRYCDVGRLQVVSQVFSVPPYVEQEDRQEEAEEMWKAAEAEARR